MFETDRIPSGWPARLAAMDEVWVPTSFHKGTFSAAGVDPSKLHVLPETVDVNFFDPSISRCPSKRHEFAFLSIFKWEARKGVDVLFPAFFRAFRGRRDVVLVVHTAAYHSDDNFDRRLEAMRANEGLQQDDPPRVVLSKNSLSMGALRELYACADAFVLPSRGEGWGRPYVEGRGGGLRCDKLA
jgi:glycosyltransferase involved in cell wall biosynthesis